MSSSSDAFWDSPRQMVSYLLPQPHCAPQALALTGFYQVLPLGLPFHICPHVWSLL